MSGEPVSPGAWRAHRALDAANFFLADVRDGLGPYLAIYLLTVPRWDEASIGVVMSIATAAGLVAQTPAGALVDATRAKRAIVATAALFVTGASLAPPWLPQFLPVAITQAAAHAASAVFGPAIAAITLGRDVAQGAVITAQGVGAALSTTLAGLVVVHAGYAAAFLTLAAVAGARFLVFLLAMPETKAQDETMRPAADGDERADEHSDERTGDAAAAAVRRVAAR